MSHAVPLASPGTPLPRWALPEWFLLSQTLLPGLLLLPGTQPFRLPIRVAAFAVSLGAFGWWLVRRHLEPGGIHPAGRWLLLVVAYLAVMVFHPTTNSLPAGAAQLALYLAVLAPVFWMPARVRTAAHVMRLLTIVWAVSALNAVVAVLQVYDPARWLPAEFSRVVTGGDLGLAAVSYIGPNGQTIVRPPGLFDTPGAASAPAAFAALLGFAFLVQRGPGWKRALGLASAIVGLTAVYLTQVRTCVLVLAGMLLFYAVLLVVQRRGGRALLLLAAVLGTFSIAVGGARRLGGAAVIDRVASLFAASPAEVYYQSGRGGQLEHGLRVLAVEYPFGAGLGRWGMMRRYFGDEGNLASPGIWAEVQYPAWILDGGLVLLAAYVAALVATTARDLRLVGRATDPRLQTVAAMILAANAGAVAMTFGLTPFTSQIGLQYWLLAGALFGASRRAR